MEFYGNPKPFGVIGLVLAIFSLIFAIIPCIGFYACIPSLISIGFATISYLYLKQNKEPKGVPFAGIIVGIIALTISIGQYVVFKGAFEAKTDIQNTLQESLKEKIIENLKDQQLLDSLETLENDSI